MMKNLRVLMMRTKLLQSGMMIGLLFAVCAMEGYAAETVKVTFAYQDTSNFPFQTGDGEMIDWEKPGIAVELLHLVGEQLNLEIEFIRLPWKRGLGELQHNQIDGLFNASFKTERQKSGVFPMKDGQVDPSRKSYSNTYVLYRLKGTPVQWDGTTFHHISTAIGATRGFSIIADLKQQGITVEEVNTTLQNFLKLLAGRIDGVAALEAAADFILETHHNDLSEIEKVHPPLKSKPYYLMLSHQFVKEYPQQAEDIWNMIVVVRDSVEFKQRITKYSQLLH